MVKTCSPQAERDRLGGWNPRLHNLRGGRRDRSKAERPGRGTELLTEGGLAVREGNLLIGNSNKGPA
jgi:hypothetical protein